MANNREALIDTQINKLSETSRATFSETYDAVPQTLHDIKLDVDVPLIKPKKCVSKECKQTLKYAGCIFGTAIMITSIGLIIVLIARSVSH